MLGLPYYPIETPEIGELSLNFLITELVTFLFIKTEFNNIQLLPT